MHPIVLAAGGTAGHLFPALAAGRVLAARGHRIVLLTDTRVAARAAAEAPGWELHVIASAAVAGRGAAGKAAAGVALARGVMQARGLIASLRPAAVVGFGGYPSVPPLLAARLVSPRPAILLHEQNAVLGGANRFLAARVDRVALSHAGTKFMPADLPSIVTGNPVRPEIAVLAGQGYAAPDAHFDLLVVGGSLGARVFADVVPPALGMLAPEQRARIRLVQQARAEDVARVTEACAALGIAAEIAPFLADMPERLARAHLVIARAGATTVAELAAAGRPAILVPLPGAVDADQALNAATLAAAGAAWPVAQTDFTPASLAARLTGFLADPQQLAHAAASAASLARPHAAEALADAVEAAIATREVAR
jgi:UDP-N-acetylglucosamine--N-acetylmuramyl-(pentapeptide) pyrophosphoryl-undecaprenol N-acetylglucosamine transferase